MDINYTGQHVEITDAIKDYADKKFAKIKKHGARITSIHVSFHVEHKDQVAKATVHIPGHEIFAQHKSDDLYKSIDFLTDKLLTQLDKHK